MFSVHDEFVADYRGTLEKLATIGFQGVEFATFADVPAEEMKKTLDEFGLVAVSSHVSGLEDPAKLEEAIEYAKVLGLKYLVCPYAQYERPEKLSEMVKILSLCGKMCAEAGIGFAYHNHAQEFELVAGKPIIDHLYGGTDAAQVESEFDVYWIKFAGFSAVEYLNKYAGRIPLVHLKDMTGEESRISTEVGEGIIDMKPIVVAAQKGGAKWLIVEQENFNMPKFDAIKVGFENIKKLV